MQIVHNRLWSLTCTHLSRNEAEFSKTGLDSFSSLRVQVQCACEIPEIKRTDLILVNKNKEANKSAKLVSRKFSTSYTKQT